MFARDSVTKTFGGNPPPLGYPARMSLPPAGWYPDAKMPATLFFCDDAVWSQTVVPPMQPAVYVEDDEG